MNEISKLLNDINNSPFPVSTFLPELPSINQENMRCLKYNCDKQATFGFKGCTAIHGMTIKMMLEQLDDTFDADKNDPLREAMSVSEAIHYQSLNN